MQSELTPAAKSMPGGLGVQRPLVIRQAPIPGAAPQQLNVIRPGNMRAGPQQNMMVRTRMVPNSPARPRQALGQQIPVTGVPAVHLTPAGYHVQQPLQRVPHVMSPQRPQSPRQAVVNVRPGVIQQTDQSHQSHQPPHQPLQYVQRYPQPQGQGQPQAVMVHQNTVVSTGQHWRPAQRLTQQPRQVMPGHTVQRPLTARPPIQQQQQQQHTNNIAYDVEHVFVENGKEVRKMPVLINNETVWVE